MGKRRRPCSRVGILGHLVAAWGGRFCTSLRIDGVASAFLLRGPTACEFAGTCGTLPLLAALLSRGGWWLA